MAALLRTHGTPGHADDKLSRHQKFLPGSKSSWGSGSKTSEKLQIVLSTLKWSPIFVQGCRSFQKLDNVVNVYLVETVFLAKNLFVIVFIWEPFSKPFFSIVTLDKVMSACQSYMSVKTLVLNPELRVRAQAVPLLCESNLFRNSDSATSHWKLLKWPVLFFNVATASLS